MRKGAVHSCKPHSVVAAAAGARTAQWLHAGSSYFTVSLQPLCNASSVC